MPTALVAILRDEVDDRLLELAEQFAAGGDTEIVVCKFVDESDYQDAVKEASREGHQVPITDEVREQAEAEARDAAAAVFSPETDYTVRGAVGELPEAVLEVAEELSSDHLFLNAKRRSPAGKVLFRDVAQSIMIQFDGAVTIHFE